MTENLRFHLAWLIAAIVAVVCVLLTGLTTMGLRELVLSIFSLGLLSIALLWLATPRTSRRLAKWIVTGLVSICSAVCIGWAIKTDRPIINVKVEYLIAQIHPDKSLVNVEAFVQNNGRQSTYGDNWKLTITSGPNTFVGIQKFGQIRAENIAINEPELANEEFPVGKPVRGWLYFEFEISPDEMHSLFNCDNPPKDAAATLSLSDTREKRQWISSRKFSELIQSSCKKFSPKSEIPPFSHVEPLQALHRNPKLPTVNVSVAAGAVKGNDNVVGNVVTGNQNIVGNNNQLNVGKYPPRTLPAERMNEIIKFLAQMPPNKAQVNYVQGDGETYRYAKQIDDMLRAANWDVGEPSTVMIFGSGPPTYGVEIRYTGEKLGVGQTINMNDTTSWGRLGVALSYLQGGKDMFVDPEPNWTAGTILITVFPSPLSKPQ
jgi:hypothetical protein